MITFPILNKKIKHLLCLIDPYIPNNPNDNRNPVIDHKSISKYFPTTYFKINKKNILAL